MVGRLVGSVSVSVHYEQISNRKIVYILYNTNTDNDMRSSKRLLGSRKTGRGRTHKKPKQQPSLTLGMGKKSLCMISVCEGKK